MVTGTEKTMLKLETPDLAIPSASSGPVSDLIEYRIERRLNAPGTFTARFPASDPMALEVVRGWRASFLQEGNDPALNPPSKLMFRGEVTGHRLLTDSTGFIIAEINGFTGLGTYGGINSHLGQSFTDATMASIVAAIAPGATVSVPSRTSGEPLTITFNNETQLANLLKLNDFMRTGLRERFDTLALDYVDEDDIPNPTFLPSGVTELLFTNIEAAGPELDGIMLSDGVGLIIGTPLLAYEGQHVFNKVRPVGVDWNGEVLGLDPLTSVPDSPFDVRTGTNPDGSSYYYLRDDTSAALYGEIESQLVRSDVKNPSNDATTKAATQRVLFAVASTELLRMSSEVISFSTQIANGDECWALPGDRVHVKYKGLADSPDGGTVPVNVNQYFVIAGRTDVGTSSGIRTVQFDLIAMMISRRIPDLPLAVPIPIAKPDNQWKREAPKTKEAADKAHKEAITKKPIAHANVPHLAASPLPKHLQNLTHGNGAYESCCADQSADIPKGGKIPPFLVYSRTLIPWAAAAVQDLRFIERWGNTYAAPDPSQGWISIDSSTDRAIVILSSSSGPVRCVMAAGTGTVRTVDEWDSPSPANFGGDGHTWWGAYWIVPTPGTDYLDFNGTVGPFRQVTFVKCSIGLHDGVTCVDAPHAPRGTNADGVQLTWVRDIQYSGSHFGHAEETAHASQGTLFDDFLWYFGDAWYRSIDNLEFIKQFHDGDTFNHDDDSPGQLIPLSPGGGAHSSIDWLFDTRDEGGLGHTITATQKVIADAAFFPGACRVLAVCATLKLQAIGSAHLID